MTLLANRLAQVRPQASRIHNRIVQAVHGFVGLPACNVQFAGAMTALAADGGASEDRRAIPVQGVRYRLSLVAVAEDATRLNLPVREHLGRESRRQIPRLL